MSAFHLRLTSNPNVQVLVDRDISDYLRSHPVPAVACNSGGYVPVQRVVNGTAPNMPHPKGEDEPRDVQAAMAREAIQIAQHDCGYYTAETVSDFYLALGSKDYYMAWLLGGSNIAGTSYDQWVAGYAAARSV